MVRKPQPQEQLPLAWPGLEEPDPETPASEEQTAPVPCQESMDLLSSILDGPSAAEPCTPVNEDVVIVPVHEPVVLPSREELKAADDERIKDARDSRKAASTLHNYARRFSAFENYCRNRGEPALPADPRIIAAYLTERAKVCKKATVRNDWAGIRHAHVEAGHDDVVKATVITEVLEGLAKSLSGLQNQAQAMTEDCLDKIRETACKPRRFAGGKNRWEQPGDARRRGLQDIALVSVMRDAMLRRSEASRMLWSHLQFQEDPELGEIALLLVPQSKTDQEGKGRVLLLGPEATADLRAMQPDIASVNPDTRVFPISGGQIYRRIRAAALTAGLGEGFSGHSMRIGMTIDLTDDGAEIHEIMIDGRWETPTMPARYIRGRKAVKGAVAKRYRRRACK